MDFVSDAADGISYICGIREKKQDYYLIVRADYPAFEFIQVTFLEIKTLLGKVSDSILICSELRKLLTQAKAVSQ